MPDSHQRILFKKSLIGKSLKELTHTQGLLEANLRRVERFQRDIRGRPWPKKIAETMRLEGQLVEQLSIVAGRIWEERRRIFFQR